MPMDSEKEPNGFLVNYSQFFITVDTSRSKPLRLTFQRFKNMDGE